MTITYIDAGGRPQYVGNSSDTPVAQAYAASLASGALHGSKK